MKYVILTNLFMYSFTASGRNRISESLQKNGRQSTCANTEDPNRVPNNLCPIGCGKVSLHTDRGIETSDSNLLVFGIYTITSFPGHFVKEGCGLCVYKLC